MTTDAPATYTPTAIGSAPSYGQKGDSVAALQTDYNAKNASTPGFVPLKVDGYYGPLTEAALNPPKNNLVVTSGNSRTATNQASSSLDAAYAQFGITDPNQPNNTNNGGSDTTTDTAGTDADPYIQQLKTISSNSDAASKLLIQNILTSKQTQSNSVDSQYDNYKRGLQLLGIQHNDAQSAPELLMGHIQQAENDHQSKLQTIVANTNKALATAQTARDNGDFKELQAQMNYVKQLNTEKQTELKNYNDTLTKQPKVAGDVAHSVYSTLQTLSPDDQQAFIQAVAGQYKLPLGVLTTALTDEKAKADAADVKSQTAQATLDSKTADKLLSPSEAKTLGVKYGTTQAQAAKMGIVPTTKTSGASGTGKISKAQIALGEQKLNASRGTDHFVDPYVYQQAYEDWTSPAKGGTTKAFILAYPPKDYVNPAATNLPTYLMPPKAATKKS